MSDQTDNTSDPDDRRDDRGRFAVGNKLGKGNPVLRRAAELQSAVRSAIGPDALHRVLTKLLELSEAGDPVAIRCLLEFTLGKPKPMPTTIDIALPPLTDAAAIAQAQRRILEATAAGELDLDASARLTAGLAALATVATAAQLTDQPVEPDPRFL